MIFGLERDEGYDDSATTLNYKKCDKPTVNYNVGGEGSRRGCWEECERLDSRGIANESSAKRSVVNSINSKISA